MSSNFNFYQHRQFYIDGLTGVGPADSLKNHETAVTEALRRLCPVFKFEQIKPLPLRSRVTRDVVDQGGNVIEQSVSVEATIRAFRNGDEIFKRADDYFKKVGNAAWYQGDAALVSIPDWGLRVDNLDSEYEFFVFDNNGFLLNNSFNTCVLVVTGVLHFVMSRCHSWPGMRTSTFEAPLEEKSINPETPADQLLVDVVAIRKNHVPYAAVPTRMEPSENYDDHCVVTVDGGTSELPSMAVEWSANESDGWSSFDEDNYGLFVTLGEGLDVTIDPETDGSPEWRAIYNAASESDKANMISSIETAIAACVNRMKGLNFEVKDMSAFSWSRGAGERSFALDPFPDKTVKDLGITVTVPVEYEVANADRGIYENGFTYTLTSLPKGSRFYASTKAVQFSDEIRIWQGEPESSSSSEETHAVYENSSKAYPCGIGRPFFSKEKGLQFIPLGKYVGTVQDYSDTLRDEEDPAVMNDESLSPDVYTAQGGYAGSHVYPLLTPKAEDVMIFVGNRNGMIKLTPYVDYTIEESGSPITGNMPAIMLMGRVPVESTPIDPSDPFAGLVGNGPLTAIQLGFPLPELGSNLHDETQDANDDVFIRVFVGYRRGNVSSYWGPLADKIPQVSISRENDIAVAAHGFSIANTVNVLNAADDVHMLSDSTLMLSTATMAAGAIPWSVLPRECFLEFDAGRYTRVSDCYTSRILLDRTFALGAVDPRDVELHALIDERYGLAYSLCKSTVAEDNYFDAILNTVFGAGRKNDYILATAEPTGKTHVFEVNSLTKELVNPVNYEAFHYVELSRTVQITEAINSSLWQTWFTQVDDAEEEVNDESDS